MRVGNLIYISATAAVDEAGSVFASGDAYKQAKRCFEIIQKALQDLGADTSCVVLTRMFITDITLWAEFGRAPVRIFWRKSACYKYGVSKIFD